MKTIIINTFIVLTLLCLSTEVAVTKESGRKKRETRELRILLKVSEEKPLAFENWMKNTGYFTISFFRDLRENNVLLSRWMSDPLYFHPAFYNMAEYNIPGLESWMTDNEYFYHSVPEINDGIMEIEEWMADSNYFMVS